jgi:hypothetical protein
VHIRPDPPPTCGFCDGTGLWTDRDSVPVVTDPCPLCEGTGVVTAPAVQAGDDVSPTDALTLSRLLTVLPRLTAEERQRLYEELHARWDCRIYRA